MSLPFYDAVRQLQDEYLEFPAFSAAHQQIEANFKMFRATGVAQNLMVLGESGTGKTTLAQIFTKDYPTVSLPERDLVPVLYASVPAAATIAGTVESILAQLGDPAPERGTVSVKTARAVKLARACGVEILIIDEAQHIQDRGRSHSQYFVGDWLKSFMDALSVPVILLGLQRTQSLLQVNEQLRRRFTHRLSLSVQQDEAGDEECLRLFTSMAGSLPITIDPRPYGWGELAKRIHYATDGRVAYIKKLLIGAYGHAASESLKNISVTEMSEGFGSAIWPEGIGSLNPFHPTFPFRPLDRQSEPFQIGDMNSFTYGRGRK
jgi:adenylate kinase family enzyme